MNISILKNYFWYGPFWRKAILVAIVLTIGVGGYNFFFGNKGVKTTYQTETAEKGTIVVSVTGSGKVSSANSSDVTTSVGGVVKKILVKNDQLVKAGQAIALVDLDQSSKQKYSSALSSYQSAKNSLDSAKSGLWTAQSKAFAVNQKFMNDAVARELAATDPTYIQENADWLAAESNYKIQQDTIRQMESNVNNAWLALNQQSPTIYAPISGTITGLSLQVGSVVSNTSTTKIASVVTNANPTISINLTEIDAPKVKVGDRATVTLDAFSDKTFTGTVASIDTVGITSSGVTNYPTVIKLDTNSKDIFANMSAQASIMIDSKPDVLLVSSSAVQSQNGSNFVRVMKGGKVSQVTVETGLVSDNQTEIVSGLNEGETVVTATITTGGTTRSANSTTSPFGLFGGNNRNGGGQIRGANFGR